MENSSKSHACTYINCNASFDRPYRLTQHILGHLDVKTFKCCEDNCGRSYSSKSHLHRHIKVSHSSDSSVVNHYNCPKCLKAFANQHNLNRHLKTVHTDKFSCGECSEFFRKKHLLVAHMYRHTGIKSFKCELCDKEFATFFDKKKHLKYHRKHSCEDCFMEFNQWSKYLKHRKTCTLTKEYICDYCQRKFSKRVHIVRHMKTHYQITVKLFSCPYDECTRVYNRNSNLKSHIKAKHDKITHDCPVCSAKLTTKGSLTKHMKTHEKDSSKCLKKPVITKETGRKDRRDKGTIRPSTTLKLLQVLDAINANVGPLFNLNKMESKVSLS